jgi:hypothetical protein
MSGQKKKRLNMKRMRQGALARWENEGGANVSPGGGKAVQILLAPKTRRLRKKPRKTS